MYQFSFHLPVVMYGYNGLLVKKLSSLQNGNIASLRLISNDNLFFKQDKSLFDHVKIMVCLVSLFENKLLETTVMLTEDTCTIKYVDPGVKAAEHGQIIVKKQSPLLLLN